MVGTPLFYEGRGNWTSTPGPEEMRHIVVPLSFDTPNQNEGIDIPGWTPQAGDQIINAWAYATTGDWVDGGDGCALDFGIDGQTGMFAQQNSSVVSLDSNSLADNENGTSIPGYAALSQAALYQFGSLILNGDDPIKYWISSDGTQGGDPIAVSAGKGELHLLILSSADPN